MKVFMVSLGCAKNKVDSEMILGLLKKNGIEAIDNPENADILIVNTCAFIESAREEAINEILAISDYKDENKKLIVVGCLPQRYKNELIETLPEVDLFISIKEYPQIASLIKNLFKNDFKISGTLSPLDKVLSTPNYMRYIKISDGCLNRCAYCAIPLIRGTLKSRTIDDIYEEVKQAILEGAYEINLISQDTTRYGYDLYNKNSICELLEKLIALPYDFKIRMLYLYPDIVTDELINLVKNNQDKIMPYFDIPIQHSEDRMLKLMNRRGNKAYLKELLAKIRREIPNSIIRTTLILGFPTETDEEFNNLCEFIKENPFDRLGAFTYSPEEGTTGALMEGQISENVKNTRYNQLMEIQNSVSLELMKNNLGKTTECFIIDYDEENYMYVARNYAFAPDEIDGCIYVAAKTEHQLGDVVTVRIVDCDEYTLTGEEL